MTASLEWRCARCGGSRVRVSADSVGCEPCGSGLSKHDGVWFADAQPVPARFDEGAADRLAAMDGNDHFWVRQRRLLFERLVDRLVQQRNSVVELGCGAGGMLPAWESRFGSVVAVDAYRPLLARARSRAGMATLIQGDVCSTPLGGGQFDAVTAFDVIEHVNPDALLSEARRLVRPGGRLLLSAPAFQVLWSAMDERAGHRCRYDASLVGRELQRNGWRYDGHTHFQCLLFPLVFLSRRFAGGTHAAERRPGRLLDRTLGSIDWFEVAASSRFRLPFGSSIVAWATRA
jgi:SAM-dependent methyltransferase